MTIKNPPKGEEIKKKAIDDHKASIKQKINKGVSLELWEAK